MRKKNVIIAVIGGDLRQEYAIEIFNRKGYHTTSFGVPEMEGKKDVSIEEVIEGADIIMAPIPFTKNGKHINSRKETAPIEIKEFLKLLRNGQTLFGGCIPKEVREYCKRNSISYYDFMENEKLAIFNTIATAEGAIAEAISSHPANLHGSKALIFGYGRCAKVLSEKLKGLNVKVTVCARREEALAEAEAFGHQTVTFEECEKRIGEYTYIFNTVPCLCIGKEVLAKVRTDSLIIDIASQPGGVDYEEAGKLGICACLCLGLPGKYAPESSAEALTDILLSVYFSEGENENVD